MFYLIITSTIRMWKKLCDCHVTIWAGLSISITADLLGFSNLTASRVRSDWFKVWCKERMKKKRNTAVSVDRNELLMRDHWFEKKTGLSWQKGSDSHSVQLCWAEKHVRLHNISNLEVEGLQQEKTILAAKTRKLRLQWAQTHQHTTVKNWKCLGWCISTSTETNWW